MKRLMLCAMLCLLFMGCDADFDPLHHFLGSRGPSDPTYTSPVPHGGVKLYYYEADDNGPPEYGMWDVGRLGFRLLLSDFAAYEVTQSCVGRYPVGCCYDNERDVDKSLSACWALIDARP